MHPADIKAELVKAGKSQSDIAAEQGVSQPMVSQVIQGKATSHPIASRIAKAIGKPVGEIWPGKYPTATRERVAA